MLIPANLAMSQDRAEVPKETRLMPVGNDSATAPGTGARLRRRLGFFAASLGGFLVSLDVSITNSLLPSIRNSFGNATVETLSWTITSYAIAFAGFLVPAGCIADRLGRRRVFLVGFAVVGLGSVVCALSSDLTGLICGRVIQGLGAAAASPASIGLMLHRATGHERTTLAARWAGMGAVGITLGPLVGGLCTDLVSWRLAFLANVPIVAFACVLTPLTLPETDRQPGRPISDPIGALLLVASSTAATLAISQSTHWAVVDPRMLCCLSAVALFGGWFIHRSLTVQLPLLDLRILARSDVAAVTALTVLYSGGFFGLLFALVNFLATEWRLSLTQVGAAMLPMGIVVAGSTAWVGHLPRHVGYRLPLSAGVMVMAIAALLIASFAGGDRFEWRWLALVGLLGAGIALCYPLLSGAAVSGLDPSSLAAASALNQCARQLGAAAGIAATATVLGDGPTIGSFREALMLAALFCAGAAVSSRFISKQFGVLRGDLSAR